MAKSKTVRKPYMTEPYEVEAYRISRAMLRDRKTHPYWAQIYQHGVTDKLTRLPEEVPIKVGMYIVRDNKKVLYLTEEEFEAAYEMVDLKNDE